MDTALDIIGFSMAALTLLLVGLVQHNKSKSPPRKAPRIKLYPIQPHYTWSSPQSYPGPRRGCPCWICARKAEDLARERFRRGPRCLVDEVGDLVKSSLVGEGSK
jgi:hypothetical protein